jgi:hypothetical protein
MFRDVLLYTLNSIKLYIVSKTDKGSGDVGDGLRMMVLMTTMVFYLFILGQISFLTITFLQHLFLTSTPKIYVAKSLKV